jgi:cobalt-zinc-cadmium efflux system membrane fusion protein
MKNLITYIALSAVLLSCGAPEIEQEEPKEVSRTVAQSVADNPAIQTGALMTRKVHRSVRCQGRIEIPPSDYISVHSRSIGFIETIEVLPGDKVSKGQALISLSHPQLIQRQREYLEAKADMHRSRAAYERQELLKEGEATSLKEYEAIKSEYDLYRARYQGMKKELQMMGIDTERLEKREEFQSRVWLRAPASGHIHEVAVNKGMLVNTELPLLHLSSDEHLHLELQILAKDADQVQVGQQVKYRSPADGSYHRAEIVKVNQMLDTETRSLMVHCHLEDRPSGLRVGMDVMAEIEVGEVSLSGLPLDAVIKEGDRYYGFRAHEGQLQKVQLQHTELIGEFMHFEGDSTGTWVTAGAYFLE